MSQQQITDIIKGKYPKNGTFKTTQCRDHKTADCPNTKCGFDHQLCRFFQSAACSRSTCPYPHRSYSSWVAVSVPVQVAVSAPVAVSASVPVRSESARAISVARETTNGPSTAAASSNDVHGELTAEELAFMDQCEFEQELEEQEEEEDDEYEEDNEPCVEDENGFMIPLTPYFEDIGTLVAKVLQACGLTKESAMSMCVEARMAQDGVGEAGARFELNQMFTKNPLGLCEWVLTLQGWNRLDADQLYVNLMVESGHSEEGAKFMVGLFFKHWWGSEFGVYEQAEESEQEKADGK
jgi:hypothetical protein